MNEHESESVAAEELEPQIEEVEEEEVVADPGELEGMSQKVHEPPPDSPRFNEIYRKAKEGEREVERLKLELEEARKQPAPPVQPAPPQPPPAPEPQEEAPDEYEIKLKELRFNRKQANADGDYEKSVELQDEIEDIMLKMAMSKRQIDHTAITKAMKEEEVKNGVAAFVARNSWFSDINQDGTANANYDPFMAGAARELEKSMAPTWAGSYNDLLLAIESKVNSQFNPQQPPKPKVSAIATVNGLGKTSVKKGIELNDMQKQYARKMFPDSPDPEAIYLEEYKKMQGAK